MKINLLPKEERPLKQSQVRWEFLVGLVGVLVLTAILLFSWLETAKFTSLSLDYQDALTREQLLQRQVQQVQVLKSELNALKEKEKVYKLLLTESPHSFAAIAALTDHGLPNLWLERAVWRKAGVEFSGYTWKMTELSQYLNFLNEQCEQALLQSVQPYENSQFITFRVEVKGAGK